VNLAIIGHGRMGHLIEQFAPEYGFGVKLRLDSEHNGQFQGLTEQNLRGIDAAVEFSTPLAAPENCSRLADLGIQVVVGTTGWTGQFERVRSAVERNGTALVWGPNYSVGVSIFFQIVSNACRLLTKQQEYSSWAREVHHAAKKDAPSGTLLSLVEEMKRSGYDRKVDISSSRVGAFPGTHEIGFDSTGDTITLVHSARNREGFARGALRAARWTIGKKGVFDFRDIVNELE
jgi:4-hydroxy-tetrahydrodipicolinate reductase